jgi:hypothetical protein
MTEARFPHVPPARGHYESFYLRAVDPARPRGVWIRYTTHQRPGRPPTGSLWFTYFDAAAEAPYAVKQTLAAPALTPGGWIAIGESTFGPTAARGRAVGLDRLAEWQLEMTGGAEPLRHLPREWMYRARLPRTKLESPRPDAVFSGHLDVAGERVEVAGWPGMAGHNWGAEHAATWIWLHGTGFHDAPGAWLDLSVGRVRVGPVLTPWMANGAIQVDGERVRLGGPRRAGVQATPEGCRVAVRNVVVEARARPGQTVAWPYADPGGGEHHSLNCSIAELRVRLERPGRPPLELATAHGAAYELGVPADGRHGIPVQPFADG